ncbi:Hpt domain-containing protein [uncultured Maricaulis sp.]|uniref:Hpt domain-containing protein n=1 Tax=uncultured Maricaulis sp. TaxID=174710 RepID=UPI0030DC3D3D
MTDQAIDWRTCPKVDTSIVGALVAAVGPDTFAALKTQFAEDLQAQATAHLQARHDGDDPAAHQAAHALRGAALNIGLTQLGHLAGALERGERGDEGELPGVLTVSISSLMASGKS